jgi:hypothetical protein
MKSSIFFSFSLLILFVADAFCVERLLVENSLDKSERTGRDLTRHHKHGRGSSFDSDLESRAHNTGRDSEDKFERGYDYDERTNSREQKIRVSHLSSRHRKDNGAESKVASQKKGNAASTTAPSSQPTFNSLGTCDNKGHLDILNNKGEECDSVSFFCFEPGLNNHCCKCRPDCCGKCSVVADLHDPYRPCADYTLFTFQKPLMVYAALFVFLFCNNLG